VQCHGLIIAMVRYPFGGLLEKEPKMERRLGIITILDVTMDTMVAAKLSPKQIQFPENTKMVCHISLATAVAVFSTILESKFNC